MVPVNRLRARFVPVIEEKQPMLRHAGTVQEIYDAFGRGDIPAILGYLAEDVEWEHDWSEPLKWYRPLRGRDAVPQFFASLSDFEFLRFEPLAFLEGADMVFVPVRIELRVRATGRIIRDLEAHLWTFAADGKVSRFRHFVDTQQFALATAK
jgi:ketosteroid isomerase-like protein